MDEAETVLRRLDRANAMVRDYLRSVRDADEHRYATSNGELLHRERDELAAVLLRGGRDKVRWALRSVSDMIKGLIDIGSSWREDRPDEWQFTVDTAVLAHQVELKLR